MLSEEFRSKRPLLEATGIGEYVHFECCPRYFKLRFEGHEEKKKRAWREAFMPISPLLYGAGESLEESKLEELKEGALDCYNLESVDPDEIGWDEAWDEMCHRLESAAHKAMEAREDSSPVLLYQPPLRGRIGAWSVAGRADFIVVWPYVDGGVRVRVLEAKASWRERTYHRMQVAIYAALLKRALGDLGLKARVEGGVIHRQIEIESMDTKGLPSFRLDPHNEDVYRLMDEGGELDRIHFTDLSDLDFRLSQKCETCIYGECCFTRAVEGKDISLLNLSRGERKVLGRYDVSTLEDLAGLKEVPEKRTPGSFEELPLLAKDPEKAERLSSEHAIGRKLDQLVQRAQFILQGVHPGHPLASERKSAPWIIGTGYGRLPEDDPPREWDVGLGFERGSLIRVYLHVEWDYVLDRVVMLSAQVSCTKYRGKPITISKVAESLPDDPEDSRDVEKELLEGFFRKLFEAIQRVAEGIGRPDKAPMHLYFYTRLERDRLMDAVRRQPSILRARAIRDLLGLRQAIDQPMASIVQDEFMERKANKYPNPGLLPVLDQCYNPEDGWFRSSEWVVEREDRSSIDLRKVFYHGFFNHESPYRLESDRSIRLMLEPGAYKRSECEGFYSVRPRFGSQIPLEYIWAAKGKLKPDQARGDAERKVIERCMWHDHQTKDERISDEDLKLLGSKLCQALEHIERSLIYRNHRLGKVPIDVPRIKEFTLGKTWLGRACREYLDLEHFSRRQKLFEHYALPPLQRVETGRSVVFRCTDVRKSGRGLEIEGTLLYEDLELPNPDQIVNACRVKGSGGLSSGDWMVATEVSWNDDGQLKEVKGRRPWRIERSACVVIEHIEPRRRKITMRALSFSKEGDYSVKHDLPTSDPDEAREKGYMQLFERGRTYVLDEQADDIVAERAREALKHVKHNPLYGMLDDFLAGRERQPLKNVGKPAKKFVRWLKDEYRHSPNSKQEGFIRRVWSPIQIILLQGPPGTGKTEALEWGVLAHVLEHAKIEGRCFVLMTGPTHKAIHEFVSKIARCKEKYRRGGGNELDDLEVVRILSGEPASLDEVEGVRYVNYHEDEEDVRRIADLLHGQLRFADSGELEGAHPLIICATPGGMYGLMKKVGKGDPPWGDCFFDMLAVDELSMMKLPDFVLSGAFIREDAQILLTGDHRQLPPVQVHDWKKEDRRTVEEVAPFLSSQDFLRLLRGEDLGLEHVKQPPRASIPMMGLEETFRCHPKVAELLREWVYSRDGINFRSEQSDVIDRVSAHTGGLRAALEPESALVLILHDEGESHQSNPMEAKIAKAIARRVSDEGVGVITPHNAQRGLLKSELEDHARRVDTVERFQGGQENVIIVSATVSDPDYVRAESDFLLNLNRLNVALSRMRKKLVVIASRSIFEHMPTDARDYDEAILWRGLLSEVGATGGGDPEWRGSLSEFLGDEEHGSNVRIRVHTA